MNDFPKETVVQNFKPPEPSLDINLLTLAGKALRMESVFHQWPPSFCLEIKIRDFSGGVFIHRTLGQSNKQGKKRKAYVASKKIDISYRS